MPETHGNICIRGNFHSEVRLDLWGCLGWSALEATKYAICRWDEYVLYKVTDIKAEVIFIFNRSQVYKAIVLMFHEWDQICHASPETTKTSAPPRKTNPFHNSNTPSVPFIYSCIRKSVRDVFTPDEIVYKINQIFRSSATMFVTALRVFVSPSWISTSELSLGSYLTLKLFLSIHRVRKYPTSMSLIVPVIPQFLSPNFVLVLLPTVREALKTRLISVVFPCFRSNFGSRESSYWLWARWASSAISWRSQSSQGKEALPKYVHAYIF